MTDDVKYIQTQSFSVKFPFKCSALSSNQLQMTKDRSLEIIATSDDAILAKLSAMQNGYYEDPFLPYFAQGASSISSANLSESIQSSSTLKDGSRGKRIPRPQSSGLQHQPVIRRGTHARVCVMDYSISAFLELTKDCNETQVVILGSGKDTTYLRSQCNLLHQKSEVMRIKGNTVWYEIDHGIVIQKKLSLLQSCPLFDFSYQSIGNTYLNDGSFIISPKSIKTALGQDKHHGILEPCHLVTYDLRNSFHDLIDILIQRHGFKTDVNTLFVMECVQMYLSESDSRSILSTITRLCEAPSLVIFDPIIQNDQFGQVMANNLVRAGVADPNMSLLNTRNLFSQINKLRQGGFQYVRGCDFYDAYESVLTNADRKKANSVEMLDEVEEWILIMKHYCLMAASGSSIFRSNESISQLFCSAGISSPIGFSDKKSVSE
jgi:[phosphatase 2A protein]-leucine-carboxy methyltransferase